MRLETKRHGHTLPRKIAAGDLREISFDGYHFLLRLIDATGAEARVTLERHEASRASEVIAAELRRQSAAIQTAMDTSRGGSAPQETNGAKGVQEDTAGGDSCYAAGSSGDQ